MAEPSDGVAARRPSSAGTSEERGDIGLTSSQLRKARDAINILSSLPLDGGINYIYVRPEYIFLVSPVRP